MAKRGWFRILCILISSIIIAPFSLAQTERQCSAGLKTPGYTDPHGDILIEYGNSLDITCVLHDKYVQEHGVNSSRNLYFERDGKNISSEMIEIINSSSIRLHIAKPPKSSSVYTCKLKDNTTAVCLNNVVVGTKPLPVDDFDCISYNYENLTCSWTPPNNYAKTTYNLTYYFPGRGARFLRNMCPNTFFTEDKKMGCLWTIQSDPPYRQAQRTFYFELNMTNHFGSNQLNKTFSHFQHVLSRPPENLSMVNATTDSILLHWSVPSSMQAFPPGLQHRIIYESEFEMNWTLGGLFITTTDQEMKHVYFNLTGLPYAYALYDIRVSLRSKAAEPDDESMWSKNSSLTVRTGSKVPGVPPATNIGSFEIVSTGNTLNQREVYVYWQQIPLNMINGEDFEYMVTIKGTHSNIEPSERTRAYARFKNLSMNESYTFHIWSKNSVGRSENKSIVFVPIQSQRVGEPQAFTKIAFGYGKYELSWEPPKRTLNSPVVKNYTIFWCNHDRDRPYQCTGYLSWKEIPGNETMHNITVSDEKIYQFAISANSETSSSGMVWAACTVIHNKAIGKMKNVEKDFVNSTVIGLKWKLDCSDRIGGVEGFVIYYCSIVSPSLTNCKEPERNLTVNDPSAERANITGLQPYETYMLAVAVMTKHTSQSQKSDNLYITTLEGVPSTPLNVMIEKVSNSSISIKWQKPVSTNGKLKYYQIMYNNDTIETEKEEFSLTNLRSYSIYNISVMACTVECSEPSFVPLVRTAGGYPSRTGQPSVIFQNDSYIVVGWGSPENPNGNIEIYEVNFKGKLQHNNTTTGTFNVTDNRYTIEDCGGDGKYNTFYISVRAVNIFGGKRYEGPWSDELESFCRTSPNLWIWVLVPVCFFLVLALYYMAKKMYFHCQEMRDVEVKLPSGLASVVARDIVLDDWSGPKTQGEPNHRSSPDQESLIGKMSDSQNISGDSSGCSSGHESVTSSLGSATHLSSTSDSGTEQPRSTSTKDSLRQRNVGSNRSASKGYVTMPADNTNPNTWNPKTAAPGNYCVLGVDPAPVLSINPSYVPASVPQSELTKLPYILPDASTQSSPYVVAGDLQKPSNSGYVPLSSAEATDKNPSYVMAGNKAIVVPDLMRLDSVKIAEVEEKPLYVQVADPSSTVKKTTPDSFSWHQSPIEATPTKTGYVTIGDAPGPRVCSDPPMGGYIPHRHFDAKALKED